MSTLAFPLGSAYALLMLTNIVYNSFGTDGAGLQFFLFAPVSLRDVMLAKNLVACAVFTLNMLIVYVATAFLYGPPQLNIIFITLAAVAFAFPLNLAAGNLMSVYSPKRYDLAAFGRQRATAATGIVGMLVQAFVIGVSALVIFISYHFDAEWLAAPIFLLLAIPAIIVYRLLLTKSAHVALDRREVLVAEICRISGDTASTARDS